MSKRPLGPRQWIVLLSLQKYGDWPGYSHRDPDKGVQRLCESLVRRGLVHRTEPDDLAKRRLRDSRIGCFTYCLSPAGKDLLAQDET